MAMKQPDMPSLTSEEIAQPRKMQKRRFILAFVFGTTIAILGYFAGQELAGGDTNGTGAAHTGAMVTAVMGRRTSIAADFERTE